MGADPICHLTSQFARRPFFTSGQIDTACDLSALYLAAFAFILTRLNHFYSSVRIHRSLVPLAILSVSFPLRCGLLRTRSGLRVHQRTAQFERINANSLSRSNAAKTVDQVLKATSLMISAFLKAGAYDVVRALETRRKNYEFEGRYRKMIDPVLQGRIVRGVVQLAGDLGIAPYISKRIAGRMQRSRWQ